MVYHLQKKLGLEMAKADPRMVADIVSDTLREKNLIFDVSEVRQKIVKGLERCSKTNTLGGFEACLMGEIEQIGDKFRGGDAVMPAREEFYKAVDEAAKTYEFFYREHRL